MGSEQPESTAHNGPQVGSVENGPGCEHLLLHDAVKRAMDSRLDFMCCNVGGQSRKLFDPSSDEKLTTADIPPITVADYQMPNDWRPFIVGQVSPWINLDSADQRIQRMSEFAFIQEINFMNYLGVRAVIIEIKSDKCESLAQALTHYLHKQRTNPSFSVWILLPCQQETDVKRNDTWHWWYKLRTLAENSDKLSVCLKLAAELPEAEKVKRWLGEPLASFWADSSIFLMGKTGVPLLPEPHQLLVRKMFGLGCQAVVVPEANQSLEAYQHHLHNLWGERPWTDHTSKLRRACEGFLHLPHQCMADNLPAFTYRVYESYPTKYLLYKKAISLALNDLCLVENQQQTKPEDDKLIIIVLGAGRGPLVTMAMEAIKEMNKKIQLIFYVVEKNENCIPTLNYLKSHMWSAFDVTVIHSDMRNFRPEVVADIIVSEMISNFSDSQLSPEMLDGAKHLAHSNTIWIPCQYTSFLTPLHSPKLHSIIRDSVQGTGVTMVYNKPAPGFNFGQNVYDQPYGVHSLNLYLISEPQQVFTFKHPNFEDDDTHQRYGKLEFVAPITCEIMGFAGYFECQLYKSMWMSSVPGAPSESSLGWYPLVFSLHKAVKVEAGEKIVIHIWRKTDHYRVWYEWALQNPVCTAIQNCNGETYEIKKEMD